MIYKLSRQIREKKTKRRTDARKIVVMFGLLAVLVLSAYADYSNENDKYYYESSNKGGDYVLKVIKTEVSIPAFEKQLTEVQQDIDTYPKEKEKCDDDVYEWWYMHNEEEFKEQQELESKNIGIKPKPPICKPEMISFYNMYFVDLTQKEVLIEREKQLQKEIKEMKDVYT